MGTISGWVLWRLPGVFQIGPGGLIARLAHTGGLFEKGDRVRGPFQGVDENIGVEAAPRQREALTVADKQSRARRLTQVGRERTDAVLDPEGQTKIWFAFNGELQEGPIATADTEQGLDTLAAGSEHFSVVLSQIRDELHAVTALSKSSRPRARRSAYPNLPAAGAVGLSLAAAAG
jgi:hypothetical protein